MADRTAFDQKVLSNYLKNTWQFSLKNPNYINNLRAERQAAIDQYNEIVRKSEKSAFNYVKLALFVMTTQTVGMGASIFQIFDWNTVEPLTFIVSSWWLMFGSGYYLFTGSDFRYTGAFSHFKDQKFNKLVDE